jgi:peroxiredoxin
VTDKFHRKYGQRGLVVLAVTMEEKPLVAKFVEEYKFAFRTVLDPEGKANLAYRIEAIPTTIIIDAKGNLSSYLVGLPPEARIGQELRKAGLKL